MYKTSTFALISLLIPTLGLAELTDPTRPTGHQENSAQLVLNETNNETSLALSGITWYRKDPSRRRAVINGQRLKNGEMIGDTRVVAILEHTVLLRKDDRQITLKLVPLQVKQPLRNTRQQDRK